MFLSANNRGRITHRLGTQALGPAIQINPVLPTVPPEGCISDHPPPLRLQHPVYASQFIGTVASCWTNNHDSRSETSLRTCSSSFGNFPFTPTQSFSRIECLVTLQLFPHSIASLC